MTYQNDPNRRNRLDGDRSYTGWIIGGVVALALVIGLFTMFGRDNTKNSTASNNTPATTTTNRPAATAPATTGSGAANTLAAPAAPAPAR
jgi:hypothetical protein